MHEENILMSMNYNITKQSQNRQLWALSTRIHYLSRKKLNINNNIINLTKHPMFQSKLNKLNTNQLQNNSSIVFHSLPKPTNTNYTPNYESSCKEHVRNNPIMCMKKQNYLQTKKLQAQLHQRMQSNKKQHHLQKIISRSKVRQGKRKAKIQQYSHEQSTINHIKQYKQHCKQMRIRKQQQSWFNAIQIKKQQEKELEFWQSNLVRQAGLKNILQRKLDSKKLSDSMGVQLSR